MFPEWSWLMALLIGAAVGSFLNMVIHRLPRRLSFSNPPKSFCPKCKHSLGWMDLFPLFSWLSTGGKCRYCKEPIAVRYFLVEVLCGALFAGLWWQYLIVSYEPLRMAFYMAASACLVAIIFIDWELYIIPDEINALLLVLGVALQVLLGSWQTALWGALAGWGILWGIALLGRVMFGKDAMGHGDIKMMRGVGALIGPTLLLANMAIAVVAGLVIGLIMIAIAKGQPVVEEEPLEGEQDYQPESIGSLFRFGFFYLVGLDIVGVVWPGAYKLIGEEYIEENIEDDTWAPSLTTIPFGPYLAVGALACMLFAGPIQRGMKAYWDNATGSSTAQASFPDGVTLLVDLK